MARFDKYDPISGGFRANLAADWAAADGVPVGVGLDTNGRVVPGNATSGIVGIVILVKENKKAGNVVDVMTQGDIVDIGASDATGAAAGLPMYAVAATGLLTNVLTGNVRVGFMVEADRLIVRARQA